MIKNSLEVERKISYKIFNNNNIKYLLSSYPYMDIVLHDHCNAKCKFCVGNLLHKKKVLPINKQTIQKINFAINAMGIKEVLLLGGEPTLSKNLFQMINYLKTKNLNKICITTNGHRLNNKDYVDKICSSGLTHINLSLMTLNKERQQYLSGSKNYVSFEILKYLYMLCKKNDVQLRINSNVFKGNHDTKESILNFYNIVKDYCDNVKFSSLLKTDNFSTINEVTEFNKEHVLSHKEYDVLFKSVEDYFNNYQIIKNKETLGFVYNTLIYLPTKLIFNYNHSGKLMKKFIEENKVNGVKLLPTGDLSYSWNREEKDLFINTDEKNND